MAAAAWAASEAESPKTMLSIWAPAGEPPAPNAAISTAMRTRLLRLSSVIDIVLVGIVAGPHVAGQRLRALDRPRGRASLNGARIAHSRLSDRLLRLQIL